MLSTVLGTQEALNKQWLGLLEQGLLSFHSSDSLPSVFLELFALKLRSEPPVCGLMVVVSTRKLPTMRQVHAQGCASFDEINESNG